MPAPRLRSLPRNVTDVARVLTCVDGTVQNLQLSPDVGFVPLRAGPPHSTLVITYTASDGR